MNNIAEPDQIRLTEGKWSDQLASKISLYLRNLYTAVNAFISIFYGSAVETTFSASNTQTAIPHNLGFIPIGYVILWQSAAGSVYCNTADRASWTTSVIMLRCSASPVTVKLAIF